MNTENLDLYGYQIFKNILSQKEIAEVKKELNNQLRCDKKNKSILLDSPNQIILKNIFKNSPKTFLPLLEKKDLLGTLNKYFEDGFIMQSMNASLSKPLKKEMGLRPHIDSRITVSNIKNTLSLGVCYCVDNFTKKNGCTKIWPFSHLSNQRPENFDIKKMPPPVNLEAKAGDMILFLGQTWHSIGSNLSSEERWGIFAFFNPWWVKPTWDFRDCGEETFEIMSDTHKALFGFTTQVPSMQSTRNYTKIKIKDLPKNYKKAKKIN